MWKKRNSYEDYGWGQKIIASIALLCLIVTIVIGGYFLYQGIIGRIDFVNAIYMCLAHIGILFIILTILGLLLERIE
jgi:hypothetical protein